MKTSIKLVSIFIALLCVSSVTAGDQVEWNDFSPEDLEKILTDVNGTYLIHVRTDNCTGECASTLKTVTSGAPEFKRLKQGLQVHTINANNTPEVFDHLGINGDFAVYLIHKTQQVRVDGSDVAPEQAVDVLKETTNILSRHPHKLGSKEDLTAAAGTQRFVNVFVGSPNSSYWTDIELAAMTYDKPIYYTESSEVKRLFGQTKNDTFVTFDPKTNSTVVLGSYPEYEQVHHFLPTANSEIPVDFNIDTLRGATQSQYPVLIVYGETKADEDKITSILQELVEQVKPNFFVYRIADREDETQQTILDFCTNVEKGLGKQNLCILMSGDDGDGRMYRYIYTGAWTASGIHKWFQGFIDGKVSPYYRAQTISERSTARVRNLNSYTAEEFMSPPEMDTSARLILFYGEDTPSKEFHQIFEKLSTEFEEAEIKFGRIDLEQNEGTVPGAEVGVLMIDGGYTGVEPSVYTGDWSEESVRAWINEQLQDEEVEEDDETDAEKTDDGTDKTPESKGDTENTSDGVDL